MKILYIVSGLQKASGVTTFVENVVAELRAFGHEVDVVTRADEKAKDGRAGGVFVCPGISRIFTDSDGLFGSVLSLPLHLYNSTRLNETRLNKVKAYDIVHIHGLWEPWLHGWARAARKAGVKVVWSPHGMLTPWALRYKGLKKKIAWLLYQKRDLQNAAAIHVTVPSEEADVRRVGLKNKVIVVPLGVRMNEKLKIEGVELKVKNVELGGGVYHSLCQPSPAKERTCESHRGLGVARE